MLTTRKKQNVVKKHGKHTSDTGSAGTQIALLTERIKEMTDHLKTHKKDQHSRRGLIKLVSQRRKHMKYLENKDLKAYKKVVKDLGLKSKKK